MHRNNSRQAVPRRVRSCMSLSQPLHLSALCLQITRSRSRSFRLIRSSTPSLSATRLLWRRTFRTGRAPDITAGQLQHLSPAEQTSLRTSHGSSQDLSLIYGQQTYVIPIGQISHCCIVSIVSHDQGSHSRTRGGKAALRLCKGAVLDRLVHSSPEVLFARHLDLHYCPVG